MKEYCSLTLEELLYDVVLNNYFFLITRKELCDCINTECNINAYSTRFCGHGN